MISGKHAFALLLFLFLCCSSGFSQENKTASDSRNNSLRKGAWAMQFRISNNFTLSDFQGAVISIKRHQSDRSALRLGLSLDLNIEDGDETDYFFWNDTLVTAILNSDRDKQYIQIDLQYLRYPNPEKSINLFFGFGPLFRFSRAYSNDNLTNSRDVQKNSIHRKTTWAVGMSALTGVEWFILHYLSIHAEYAIEATYTRDTSYDQEINKIIGHSDSGDFKSRNLLFGISAYF